VETLEKPARSLIFSEKYLRHDQHSWWMAGKPEIIVDWLATNSSGERCGLNRTDEMWLETLVGFRDSAGPAKTLAIAGQPE
jgi:hypothetical protein